MLAERNHFAASMLVAAAFVVGAFYCLDALHGERRDRSQLTPGSFLSAPGLWIGLVVAAAFLAAAVRMRRYREPI